MKQTTQKEIADRIEKYIYSLPRTYETMGWTKKHCSHVASIYKSHLWYVREVLTSFPNAEVYHDKTYLHIEYGTGSGKIVLEQLEREIFLPEVEKTAALFGKQVINISSKIAA